MVKTRRTKSGAGRTRRTKGGARRTKRAGNCQRRGRVPRRSRRRTNKKRKGGRPTTGLTRILRETKATATAAVQGINCSSYQSPHPGGRAWEKRDSDTYKNENLMKRRWNIIAACWKGPRAENIPLRDVASERDEGAASYYNELCVLFTWAEKNNKLKQKKLTKIRERLRITEPVNGQCERIRINN